MAVKSVALVAHDNKKKELVDWVAENRTRFAPLKLYATGTTGRLLRDNLERDDIHCLLSGPLGGDQHIGAKIAEGEIDLLVFFWDPLEPQPTAANCRALEHSRGLQPRNCRIHSYLGVHDRRPASSEKAGLLRLHLPPSEHLSNVQSSRLRLHLSRSCKGSPARR